MLATLSMEAFVSPQGKWTAEDVEKLKELHAAKGDRWVEMGASLGRLPEAVRDKFRTLKLGDARKAGAWTPEEEGKLTELVSNYLAKRPAVRVPSFLQSPCPGPPLACICQKETGKIDNNKTNIQLHVCVD